MRTPLVRLLTMALALAFGPRAAAAQTRGSEPAKSPGVALGLSVGLPIAGLGMIAAAMLPSGDIQPWQKASMVGGVGLTLLGSSGGHFYIGRPLRGLAFSAGRVVLAGLGVLAITEGITHSDVSESDYRPGAARASMIQAGLCGAGILALSIWESVTTFRTAEELNQRAVRTLTLSPLVAPGRDGSLLAGISVAGSY